MRQEVEYIIVIAQDFRCPPGLLSENSSSRFRRYLNRTEAQISAGSFSQVFHRVCRSDSQKYAGLIGVGRKFRFKVLGGGSKAAGRWSVSGWRGSPTPGNRVFGSL